ncbi:pyridoxal phosphate-dependent aminotransferase [Lutimonas zeaxanthinifaciens]|uniref:pyridoxal phosphate-dependent aminotransferase n=1 Tax=Lutimonas zeaxanthinifaciens TaxID=3060215 RepID=UPI00265CE48A|nr:pyridoxal phosphate-dependent aminotransferase [Lutimonas sp. YSD2104]WKK64979.1 pyridoxal phosphate-dependent aminotransferase [Lutimonas sp. YSD2104]
MPVISSKGLQMPESPIRKLVPYAEDAKKKGIQVFHLNIGQPDIETPEAALKAVKENDIKILSYARSEGSEEYRKKLSQYYRKNEVEVDHHDIIVTTGGSEALLFTLGSVTDFGDEIIIPEPFYANYNGFSVANGINVVPIVSSIDDDFALPPIEDFEKLITAKTKAILICNPGNPTGYLYSREELEKLKNLALKHDLFLIADEVYREFVYDGIKHHSILSLEGMDEHAIVIDSVSKRYSMCGARIGCIVSKNKNLIQTALKYAQARLSSPSYALLASEAALETPSSYFENVIKEYDARRKVLIEALSEIEGVKVSRPKGAFYCIAQLPVKDADNFAQWMLEKFSDNNQTVMVAPASGFYSTPGSGKNQIRIAYVLKKESLIRSVELLKLALEQYPD